MSKEFAKISVESLKKDLMAIVSGSSEDTIAEAADMAAGSDYVIVGRTELVSAPFTEIAAELSRRIRGRR